MFGVSLWGTLLATVFGFILGVLWYGPIFGNGWMRMVGHTKETLEKGFNPAKTYGITFVLGFVQAWLFGCFLGSDPPMKTALAWGVLAGVGWVAASLATNDLFERRPVALTLINGGYHVVRFVLIGLSFGLLG